MLTVKSMFIPFSISRSAEDKDPSLNWKVSVFHNDKLILKTDYTAGNGHCPAYKLPAYPNPKAYARNNCIKAECETGFVHRPSPTGSGEAGATKKRITPNEKDVIYALVMDADVLQYNGFKDWADNYGYDSDSIKHKAVYDECLEQAYKLRAALGTEGLEALRESFQDY